MKTKAQEKTLAHEDRAQMRRTDFLPPSAKEIGLKSKD